MSITVTCKCGKSYQVKDQFAGHETNCPYCGKPLKISSREKAEELLTNPPPTEDQPSSEKETSVSGLTEQRQAQAPSSSGMQQAKSADSEDKEICTNCGRQMPRSEQACVFKGQIVCKECDQSLRKVSKRSDSEDKRAERPKFAKPRQKLRWLSLREANKVGIAVSVLFLLTGIYTLSQGPRKEARFESIEGKFASVTYTHSLEYRVQTTCLIAVALCLLVRSFLSGLGLARGVITAFGAYLSTLPLILLISFGITKEPGVVFLDFAFCFLGIALLIFGFMPDKDYKEKSVAVVLAILCGPLSWLYVYRKNRWKFWLNFPICLLSPCLLFLPIPPLWIWAIIDMARRPASYYENYITEAES